VLKREWEEIFRDMDKDQDEQLSSKDIQACADQAGVSITEESMVEIMRECDVNQNGKIDKKDFVVLMETAWERTEELTMKDRQGQEERMSSKQVSLDNLLAKLRRSTGEEEPAEEEKPLTENEQAEAKKQIKRWNDELELENLRRSMPRTAEGEEKEANRDREAHLVRCEELYSLRDEVAALVVVEGEESEKVAELRKRLASEEMEVEVMELETSLLTMGEEEKATAEARLTELKEALAAANAEPES